MIPKFNANIKSKLSVGWIKYVNIKFKNDKKEIEFLKKKLGWKLVLAAPRLDMPVDVCSVPKITMDVMLDGT